MKKLSAAENCDINLLTLPAGETAMPEGCSIPADSEENTFRDLKLLGMGGMGIVYEAEDQALERKVALKMLRAPYRNDSVLVGRFIKEARLTARIDHPNIVAVHHLGRNKECGAYFSMRRIKGKTLQSVLRRLREGNSNMRRQYTTRRLLNIFVAACNGVAAAHQQGILHCDLKPSNIMIGDRGEVWVLDWGVARETGDTSPVGNTVAGTPAFMAPELLSGREKIPNQVSEVYALGAILFCMLTWNEAPVDTALPPEELQKHVVSGKILPLRRSDDFAPLPSELAAICRKAMARNPEKRYPDVAALLADLHNYQDGFPVRAYSHYPFYRIWKFLRRRPLIPIACMAAAATFALYHFADALITYTDDKIMLRQAEYNATLADSLIHQAKMQHLQLSSPSSGTGTLDMLRSNHRMQTGINLSMLEIFAAFDALNAASEAATESFMRSRGAALYKNLLRLQMFAGDPVAPVQAVEKFRQRRGKLLDYGCLVDPELKSIVSRIDERKGRLSVHCANPQMWTGCSLVDGEGRAKTMSFSAGRLDLASGNNRLRFSGKDGSVTAAFFRCVPGESFRLHLPDKLPPAGFIFVPADHWFAEIPQSEPVLKLLPEYLISAAEVSVTDLPGQTAKTMLCSAANAEKHCQKLSKVLQRKVRLPDELELRKSLTRFPDSDPGRSFYGAEMLQHPVFVRANDGQIRVFDPAKNGVRRLQKGDTAAIRIVIE